MSIAVFDGSGVLEISSIELVTESRV